MPEDENYDWLDGLEQNLDEGAMIFYLNLYLFMYSSYKQGTNNKIVP